MTSASTRLSLTLVRPGPSGPCARSSRNTLRYRRRAPSDSLWCPNAESQRPRRGPSPRPEPPGDRQIASKIGLTQLQRRLDDPILWSGIPNFRTFPLPPSFGDLRSRTGTGQTSRPSTGFAGRPKPGHPDAGLRRRRSDHPRSLGTGIAGDPVTERHQSVAGSYTRLNRSSGCGRDRPPPNGEAWSASPIPERVDPPGPLCCERQYSPPRLSAYSLFPGNRCRPSPMCRALPARSTTAAPPLTRSAVGAPSRNPRAGCPKDRGTRMVPCVHCDSLDG